MSSIKVSAEQLHQYAATLEGLHEKISKIDDYMKSTACDKSGFTGLFVVLQPVVDLVSNLYGETLKFGHDRLTSLTDGVKQAADAYTQHDTNAAKLLEKFIAEFDGIDAGSSAR